MISALLLSALAALEPPAEGKKKAPPPPPKAVKLPALASAPLLGSPSFSFDGKRLLVSRFCDTNGVLATKGALYLIDPARPAAEKAVEVEGPNLCGRFRAELSRDGKWIAYLAEGELWARVVPGVEAADAPPLRLYPPKEGEALLGPKLSHARWSADGTWLLIQSPQGWARVTVESGDIAPLPLKPVDLTDGSVTLGPDGTHVAFVRPRSGPGWINGAKVVVINLETGHAQLADFNNDYTEALSLPDGQLAGKDADGALWVLRGGTRVAFFKPPAVPSGANVIDYTISPDSSHLAYVVTGPSGHAQLFVGEAPRPPKWAKPGGGDGPK